MKKITSKVICLLMTLFMLFGLLPLAGLGTAKLAAANAGETVIKAADIGDIEVSPAAAFCRKGKCCALRHHKKIGWFCF